MQRIVVWISNFAHQFVASLINNLTLYNMDEVTNDVVEAEVAVEATDTPVEEPADAVVEAPVSDAVSSEEAPAA
jgi:hypothetical protein